MRRCARAAASWQVGTTTLKRVHAAARGEMNVRAADDIHLTIRNTHFRASVDSRFER
jgi:hypothetical protein